MTRGRLILMPNTLDFGVDDSLDLREVLPQRVIETAARLTHWAAENAKTTRALLKRVDDALYQAKNQGRDQLVLIPALQPEPRK